MKTLDVERLRRRSPTEVVEDFSRHRQEFDKLTEQFGNVSTMPVNEPSAGISRLTNEQLADTMHEAAIMYGHYTRLESAAEQLQKGVNQSLSVLGAVLRRTVYMNLGKDEQKDAVLMDKQYEAAQSLVRDLSYLLGNITGERKRWHGLQASYSRDFERRFAMGNTPRHPHKNYPTPAIQLTRTPRKSVLVNPDEEDEV